MTTSLSLSGPQWARPLSMFYSCVCQSRVKYQPESMYSLIHVYVSTLGTDPAGAQKLIPLVSQEFCGKYRNIGATKLAYPFQFVPQHLLDKLMFSFWDSSIRLQVICRILAWTCFRQQSSSKV